MNNRWIRNRSGFNSARRVERAGIHILVWLFAIVFPASMMYITSGANPLFVKHTLLHITAFAAIFYLNYLLISKLFFKKGAKFLFYLSTITALLVMTMLVHLLTDQMHHHSHGPKHPRPGSSEQVFHLEGRNLHQPPPVPRPRMPKNIPIFNFLITALFVTVLGVGLRYIERMAGIEKLQKEAEKEKIRSELAYLKNQISPHFFFNTLNNIYSLIEASPKEGQQAIIQLARLMRYMLYESERGNITIQQEVDFLSTYIDLMRLRLNKMVELAVDFPAELPLTNLPPLIFLPFVENAFKHGVSTTNPSRIEITLEADIQRVVFRCLNSVHARTIQDVFSDDSGIGLENVKRRLQLLLPDQHHLTITRNNQQFEVILVINNH